MNYQSLTVRELRKICCDNDKYKGHWSCVRKAELINFMNYCDESMPWKTKPAPDTEEISEQAGAGEELPAGDEQPTPYIEAVSNQPEATTSQPAPYIDEQNQPSPYEKYGENPAAPASIPPVHSARGVVPAPKPLEPVATGAQLKKLPVDFNSTDSSSFLAQNFHIKFSDEVFWPPQHSGSETHPDALLTANRAAWGMTGIYRQRWLPKVSGVKINPPAVLVGSTSKPVIIDCPCCKGTGILANIFTCPECTGECQIVLSTSGGDDQHPGGQPRRDPSLLAELN